MKYVMRVVYHPGHVSDDDVGDPPARCPDCGGGVMGDGE